MTDALARWQSYPPPNAPRSPCAFCLRSFIVTCTEDRHQSCGNYQAEIAKRAKE